MWTLSLLPKRKKEIFFCSKISLRNFFETCFIFHVTYGCFEHVTHRCCNMCSIVKLPLNFMDHNLGISTYFGFKFYLAEDISYRHCFFFFQGETLAKYPARHLKFSDTVSSFPIGIQAVWFRDGLVVMLCRHSPTRPLRSTQEWQLFCLINQTP